MSDYLTHWQRNRTTGRMELCIRTASGRFVAAVSHARDVAAAIAKARGVQS